MQLLPPPAVTGDFRTDLYCHQFYPYPYGYNAPDLEVKQDQFLWIRSVSEKLLKLGLIDQINQATSQLRNFCDDVRKSERCLSDASISYCIELVHHIGGTLDNLQNMACWSDEKSFNAIKFMRKTYAEIGLSIAENILSVVEPDMLMKDEKIYIAEFCGFMRGIKHLMS